MFRTKGRESAEKRVNHTVAWSMICKDKSDDIESTANTYRHTTAFLFSPHLQNTLARAADRASVLSSYVGSLLANRHVLMKKEAFPTQKRIYTSFKPLRKSNEIKDLSFLIQVLEA